MKPTWCYALTGAVLMAVVSSPARADTASDQAATCAKGDADANLRVGACTWGIQSGLWSGVDLAGFYYNRAHAYHTLKRDELAIQDYNQAIALKPDYQWAISDRGNSYSDLGQDARAIEDYDLAIKLDPSDPIAFLDRGLSYAKMDNRTRAIEDYNQAIVLKPDYGRAYYNKGLSEIALGDTTNGNADVARGMQLDPSLGQ